MPNLYGLNWTLGAAVSTIGLIVVIGSGDALVKLNTLAAATAARAHSNQVIQQLDAFRTAMLNQETGLRGFLLSGNQLSLAPYDYGRLDLVAATDALERLVAADPVELQRLKTAENAAHLWQTSIGGRAIAEMADPSTRAQAISLESSGDGRNHFDQFRINLRAVQIEEEKLLVKHERETERAQRIVVDALWISTVLTLLICAGIGWAIRRLISRPLQKLAAAMRRLAQRELSVEVPNITTRNEIGDMARAVQVFKNSMIELDRTALLRVTADTLPAMIGYIEASQRVGFLNSEFDRWFDFHVEDVSQVYGQRLDEVFGADEFPGAGQELRNALHGDEQRFERRLLRRDGVLRDLDAIYRPHRSLDGSVLGVVTLLTDITERNQLDRQLLQQTNELVRSNEELEQFAYVASHDLKAPLRGIENLVSWIGEDLEGQLTGDTLTNMGLLKNRVQRLEKLLDDLLSYSRAGRKADTVELVDVTALVEELALLSSPPQGFTIAAGDGLPKMKTARAPLTQIFQNLIGNAIKHHDDLAKGHVAVEGRAIEDGIEFIVTDDGPGIEAAFRARVFGMFQTLKPRDDVEGSGMGLAIVKKLVERHNGRIWLEGGRENRGLAVHFTWMNEPARG